MKVMPIYKSASLTVCSPDCGDSANSMQGAQALIDSTGKASDILRRIQVRVGLEQADVPNYAIETSKSLCKRFYIDENGALISNHDDESCEID